MYVGHLGIGLGARRLSACLPVWFLLVASISPDLADAISGFTPWGNWVNYYSHSLYGIASLTVIMALSGALLSRKGAAAILAAALVASHLLVDYITSHISAWPGGPTIGLGLYRHPIADFITESIVILVGVYFYHQSWKQSPQPRWVVPVMVAGIVGFQFIADTVFFS